jgi:hypothetical protein
VSKAKGRPSKLTDSQWAEVGRRYAAGEGARALGREFGVTDTAIRKRLGSQSKEILSAAQQLASVEKTVELMPLSSQMSVRSLADQLKAIGSNLARATRAGSDTAAHLAELARDRAKHVLRDVPDDAGHLVSRAAMDDVTDLSIAANRAMAPAIRLVIAGQGKDDPENDKPQTLEELYDRLLG